ncbi:MAG: hypothetical protein ABL993_10150 [Vicinamibacterales bacterium]
MLRRLRARTASVAAALLVSIATLGLPHVTGLGHDADCAIVVVVHDASAHQVQADGPRDTEHPVHCLACHWARSFRPTGEVTYLPAASDEIHAPLLIDASPVAAAATVAQPPLRSPPPSPVAV